LGFVPKKREEEFLAGRFTPLRSTKRAIFKRPKAFFFWNIRVEEKARERFEILWGASFIPHGKAFWSQKKNVAREGGIERVGGGLTTASGKKREGLGDILVRVKSRVEIIQTETKRKEAQNQKIKSILERK